MAELSTSYQTLASWADATHRIYLQARYRSSTVSGNTAHVMYRLLVNVDTQQTSTTTKNSWVLNGTGASSASQSGGSLVLSGGDNVIAEIESGAISGGSGVGISGGYYFGYYNWGTTSLSGSATMPSFASAPTGLGVYNIQPKEDGFQATVQISGWGTGSGTKYRELQVWTYNASSLVEPRRYQPAYGDGMSSIIICNNSSYGSLNITPNTRYTIGAYATNGSAATGSIRFTDAVTLASAPQIQAVNTTDYTATVYFATSADGGYYSKTYEYSLDGTTWHEAAIVTTGAQVERNFGITGLQPGTGYTLSMRVNTQSGTNPAANYRFYTTKKQNANKLYGSVSNQTKEVNRLYGSVGGKTKRINKLYASVNGKTKLVFEDRQGGIS